jgi:UDP-glucose 4-epimerase
VIEPGPWSLPLRGAPALVLGASGFLGSSLVVALDALGARVRATVRGDAGPALARAEVVRADLRDPASLARAVPDEGFVFFTAGLSGALGSLERATLDLEVNGRGVLNLLEALRERRSRARVVFPSSQLVYGHGGATPLREDDPPAPRSLYAVHKLLAEHYGRVYAETHGIEWVTLRIANPYGPRQRASGGAYGLVRHFLDLALAGKPVPVWGDGSQRRGYVFVEDVVRAFLLAALKGERGRTYSRTYNIGHPSPCSVRAMAEAVVRAAGTGSVATVPWPSEAQRLEPGDARLDLERARAELGWEPTVALEDGLARTVAFLRGERPS